MIPEKISRKIVSLSIHPNSPGGISTVIRNYSYLFGPFYHISTTDSRRGTFIKILMWLAAFLQLAYYRIVKKCSICHCHGSGGTSMRRKLSLIKFAQFLKMKTIYHFHGFGIPENEAILHIKKYKKVFLTSDVVCVLSPQWKEKLARFAGCRNTHVVHNVIRKHASTALEFQSFPVKLLFLGYIDNSKGLFDVLSAIKKNAHSWAGKIFLTIAGTGPDNEKVKEYLKTSPMSSLAEFHGWLPHEQALNLIEQCHVMILPSYHEGLPMTLIEAMAAGKPIISSPVGSIPEIIHPGENGTLVSTGNIEALSEAIQSYVDSPEKIKEQGLKSLEIVKSYFPESVETELRQLYSNLLKHNV